MGFTAIEKYDLAKLARSEETIAELRNAELSPQIMDFLQQNNHLPRVRDYGFFPVSWLHKSKKSENISLHFLFNMEMNVQNLLEKIMTILEPPYTILVDFSFVMHHPESELNLIEVAECSGCCVLLEWQDLYVWPQLFTLPCTK